MAAPWQRFQAALSDAMGSAHSVPQSPAPVPTATVAPEVFAPPKPAKEQLKPLEPTKTIVLEWIKNNPAEWANIIREVPQLASMAGPANNGEDRDRKPSILVNNSDAQQKIPHHHPHIPTVTSSVASSRASLIDLKPPSAAFNIGRNSVHGSNAFLFNAVQASSPNFFAELSRYINEDLDLSTVINKILIKAIKLIDCERSSLFLVDHERRELYARAFDLQADSKDSNTNSQEIRFPMGQGVAGIVAESGETLNIPDAYADPRFNKVVDIQTGFVTRTILCMPIREGGRPDGSVIAVASLINKKGSPSESHAHAVFDHRDEKSFKEFGQLCGVAINNSLLFQRTQEAEAAALLLAQKNAELFEVAVREKEKAGLLLELAKDIYYEENLEELSRKIMLCAKNLLRADQSSLFLVDYEKNELYSAVFGGENGKRIRFPVGRGISGHVAKTGEIVNIADAYQDERFNRDVDLSTGYKTKTILCVPILHENKVIGVCNLINKLEGVFDQSDVELFNGFAVFCGLSLSKALLKEKNHKQQSMLQVAMELMAYHSTASPEDVDRLSKVELPNCDRLHKLDTFVFDPYMLQSDDDLTLAPVRMFIDLGFQARFEVDYRTIVRFMHTVRKNYRRVIYHNWWHGLSVAHGMYYLIKHCNLRRYYTEIEIFAMYIAAICHDIDHRGTNNAFQRNVKSPLADLYSTSVLERHHFNHTLSILNTPGHNIFEGLHGSDYTKAIKTIERSILATDLANFFANKKRLMETVNAAHQQGTSVDVETNRDLFEVVLMPSCDLVSLTKPWETSARVADVVYSEFFAQGDEEKKMGFKVMELMDRDKKQEIPRMQLGFINDIVEPIYMSLKTFLNPADTMYSSLMTNKERWKRVADGDDAAARLS